MGFKVWEPPVDMKIHGQCAGTFPSYIPKTDEERLQNHKKFFDEYRNLSWVVTEKIDGTSGTFFWKDGEFHVCTRNNEISPNDGNVYATVATVYGLAERLKANGKNIAIQGEVFGPKIQGNKYKSYRPGMLVFSIFNIDTQKHIEYEEMVFTLELLNSMETQFAAIKMVPIIDENFVIGDKSFDDILTMADGISLLENVPREGLEL